MADIIKKKGDERILHDEEVRRHFVEEMCDVLMHFGDIMLCYGITPEAGRGVYGKDREKHEAVVGYAGF